MEYIGIQRMSSIQRLSLRSENAVHVKANAGVTEAKALDRHVHWIQVPAFQSIPCMPTGKIQSDSLFDVFVTVQFFGKCKWARKS